MHYNGNNSDFYVNKLQIFEFKGFDNIPPYRFVSASKYISINETKEVALNGTLYDFSIMVYLMWKICFTSISIWWKET